MNMILAEKTIDPRIRRTRSRICEALRQLLQEKSFADISITDLTKEADVARVTFYQHFSGKEAVLLLLVNDFFTEVYDLFEELVTIEANQGSQIGDKTIAVQPVDPTDIQLIRVALLVIGPEVRKLALHSFLDNLAKSYHFVDEVQIKLLAIYHIHGMLGLLEAYLGGELALSPEAFQAATLAHSHTLLTDMLEKGWLIPKSDQE